MMRARTPARSYGEAMLLDVGIGIVAGLVAAGVMQAFQASVTSQVDGLEADEPATAKAADAAARIATGGPVPEGARLKASTAVHYLTGAAIGAAYGLLAGLAPIVTVGRGLVFGAAVWGLADELAVPALGWAPRASDTPPEKHAYGAASHAVFALVLDSVRRRANQAISS